MWWIAVIFPLIGLLGLYLLLRPTRASRTVAADERDVKLYTFPQGRAQEAHSTSDEREGETATDLR